MKAGEMLLKEARVSYMKRWKLRERAMMVEAKEVSAAAAARAREQSAMLCVMRDADVKRDICVWGGHAISRLLTGEPLTSFITTLRDTHWCATLVWSINGVPRHSSRDAEYDCYAIIAITPDINSQFYHIAFCDYAPQTTSRRHAYRGADMPPRFTPRANGWYQLRHSRHCRYYAITNATPIDEDEPRLSRRAEEYRHDIEHLYATYYVMMPFTIHLLIWCRKDTSPAIINITMATHSLFATSISTWHLHAMPRLYHY